ncbi:MAG: hypothetical protein HXX12_13525 [Geothrix sp.]|uniref:hypothetical protein n=1 Tax=Geothrix sp. TaxID=1962974 RepID=UPI001824E1C3|nr:hypothetical protein [Geothrix sp.]NWJ41977.1 hypothetical protein [Geothrix sp.]
MSGSWSSSHPSDQGLTYKLPSNLTSLRRAKGGSDADPLAGLGGPLRSALARLRPLSIDWTAEGASPELAPLDPHPAVTLDLEFQALVQDLKVRGIKGVFISMSSLQNALFIARQLRMHLPDLIIAMDWLHAELLHPDLAGDLEGIYVFSLHSPYPDLWRLSADSQDQTHVKPISPPEEKPTPLAQASAPLVQDALWLLENAAQNPKGGWQIAQVPDTPSKAPWSKRPDGDWTLRRPRYVSQLRHGQFRPVKAALEQENGQGNAEDVVHFKDAGFPWPNHIPRSADFLSVDVSYLRMGRIQRFCLPLLAIGLLLFAFRRNRKQQANLEMGASIGVQTCQAPAQLVLMILLGTVLLCTQVTCLHACLGVLWLLGGRGLFPWVEMLLFLGSCGGILWIAAGTAGRRVLTLLEATRTPFIARLRDGQGQVFLSPGWIQLATGCLMAAPALFILGQRGWEDFHPDSSGDRFAPAFHALAALEPFTGLAYLSTLLIICVFMALAIHLEGLRAFHQQRNLNLVTPEKVSGTPLQTPTEQRTKATRGWSLAACLLLPMLLYLPLLFEGGFRAVRLIPLQGVMSWIIGLGFIGLAGYAVWQYWMAWQEWRGLKIRSIALEVAPWRDAYEEVGRLYPWRPARSLSFFGKDNRSLPFKVLEEILAKSADPPLDLGLPELHGIRASIQKLADARTNQAEEARIVRDLDLELSGIFKRMDAKASYRNRQALALHTYLFFRRRLWDVKYRIYLSLLASFCLLFAGSEGLQASQSLMLLALTGIGLQLLLALRLILDLEGNGLFSAVAGTAPGKANWNQDTWSALMKPAALALLALLVARFPGLSAAAAGMLLH